LNIENSRRDIIFTVLHSIKEKNKSCVDHFEFALPALQKYSTVLEILVAALLSVFLQEANFKLVLRSSTMDGHSRGEKKKWGGSPIYSPTQDTRSTQTLRMSSRNQHNLSITWGGPPSITDASEPSQIGFELEEG
jgi:hypothetical protein